MDCDYLECIYRIMFHVKHCRKATGSYRGRMDMEALKKFS